MTILEILDRAKKDLHLHKDDLISESVRTPDLFSDYHKMYRAIRMAKKELVNKRKIMIKEKWEYYSGKAPDEVYKKKPFGHKLKFKENIAKFVDADDELLKLTDNIETLEEKEDTLQTIMTQINNRSFLINNCNKTMEFFSGDQA